MCSVRERESRWARRVWLAAGGWLYTGSHRLGGVTRLADPLHTPWAFVGPTQMLSVSCRFCKRCCCLFPPACLPGCSRVRCCYSSPSLMLAHPFWTLTLNTNTELLLLPPHRSPPLHPLHTLPKRSLCIASPSHHALHPQHRRRHKPTTTESEETSHLATRGGCDFHCPDRGFPLPLSAFLPWALVQITRPSTVPVQEGTSSPTRQLRFAIPHPQPTIASLQSPTGRQVSNQLHLPIATSVAR